METLWNWDRRILEFGRMSVNPFPGLRRLLTVVLLVQPLLQALPDGTVVGVSQLAPIGKAIFVTDDPLDGFLLEQAVVLREFSLTIRRSITASCQACLKMATAKFLSDLKSTF